MPVSNPAFRPDKKPDVNKIIVLVFFILPRHLRKLVSAFSSLRNHEIELAGFRQADAVTGALTG